MTIHHTTAAITAFAAALSCSVVLTPLVRRVAVGRGLVDTTSGRKIHFGAIPRLGGVAIVVAFLVTLGALALSVPAVALLVHSHQHVVLGVLGGGLVIAALGVYDDLVGADARLKFTVQFAAAGLAYAAGLRIEVLSLPLLGTFELGTLGLPLTLLWIAGVTNAMNLIDGLDGLAGGVAAIAAAALFSISLGHGDLLAMLVTAALGGAVVGFLFFNFNPASIFMGDTGSMFLGFVLATTSIPTVREGAGAVALLVPVLCLGVPIGDTLLAMGRRAVRGVPLFAADRGHIHHRLLACGFSQRQATLILYGSSAGLAGAALVVRAHGPGALLALGIVGAGAFVGLRSLGFLRWSELPALLAERRARRMVAVVEPVLATSNAQVEEALQASVETRIAS